MTTLEITQLFFKYYRDHRVNAMLELFSVNGIIDYVPIGAVGPATDVGRTVWEGLIDAFPDLTNEITAMHIGDNGRTVTVEVTISGTQAKKAFGIENKGRSFKLPHIFVIQTDSQGDITSMKAYWDNATWFVELGKTTLLDG